MPELSFLPGLPDQQAFDSGTPVYPGEATVLTPSDPLSRPRIEDMLHTLREVLRILP